MPSLSPPSRSPTRPSDDPEQSLKQPNRIGPHIAPCARRASRMPAPKTSVRARLSVMDRWVRSMDTRCCMQYDKLLGRRSGQHSRLNKSYEPPRLHKENLVILEAMFATNFLHQLPLGDVAGAFAYSGGVLDLLCAAICPAPASIRLT
jgi:hypothetical protein